MLNQSEKKQREVVKYNIVINRSIDRLASELLEHSGVFNSVILSEITGRMLGLIKSSYAKYN